MRQPFLTGYKRHNFKFLNFSVYTTLSVPKQPISIKNAVHCGALQSRERFQVCSVFFYTPCIQGTHFKRIVQTPKLSKASNEQTVL